MIISTLATLGFLLIIVGSIWMVHFWPLRLLVAGMWLVFFAGVLAYGETENDKED